MTGNKIYFDFRIDRSHSMEHTRESSHFILSNGLQNKLIAFDIIDGLEFLFTVEKIEFHFQPLQQISGEMSVFIRQFSFQINLGHSKRS
jgi:hypothetical protein